VVLTALTILLTSIIHFLLPLTHILEKCWDIQCHSWFESSLMWSISLSLYSRPISSTGYAIGCHRKAVGCLLDNFLVIITISSGFICMLNTHLMLTSILLNKHEFWWGKKFSVFCLDGFYVVSIHRNQALLRTHMVQNANSNRQNQTNKQKKPQFVK